MRPSSLAIALLCIQVAHSSRLAAQPAEPIKFARFPHIANDGTIAFAYQDDIWIANANGANVRRLTARNVGPPFLA
ncbi:MAG: hypothetical protein ACREOG_10615 [Gemmatimonadaceae bacterium]